PPEPPAPPPAPGDTPYGDFLRVRTAKDDRAVWAARGESVLRGAAPDRKDDLDATYKKSTRCNDYLKAPMIEGGRDLFFGYRLPSALAPDDASEAEIETKGLLPLGEWMKRYEALVREVDRAKLGWVFASTLLLQRGTSHGLTPVGTATYRRVTEIATQHLEAARA